MNQMRSWMGAIFAFTKRNGFYLSLAACLLMLGGGLYLARNRATTPSVPTPTPTPAQVAHSMDERIDTVMQSVTLSWPVSGREVLTPHSPTEPTWSDTLELWQTHAGVDILAVKGEVVYSAIDGTVTRAERDPLMGNLVEVSGADGVTTRYANLSTAHLVKLGDRVRAGDPIGAVGDTSSLESGNSPHLHFEAYQNGTWIALP